jgi:MoxR-like ATPase
MDEDQVLEANAKSEAILRLEALVDLDVVVEMMEWASGLEVAQPMRLFMIDLCQETRTDPALSMGASTRASLALLKGSRVLAASQGRDDILPDDVKALVKPVLGHRLILSPEAVLRDETVDHVMDRIISRVKVPVLAGAPGRGN